jgi:hypothetical protein
VSRPLSGFLDGPVPVPTKEQAVAYIQIIAALAEAIRGLGSVPSGHLYAYVMGGMTFPQYSRAIEVLKGADLVKEEGHVLSWVGPLIPPVVEVKMSKGGA